MESRNVVLVRGHASLVINELSLPARLGGWFSEMCKGGAGTSVPHVMNGWREGGREGDDARDASRPREREKLPGRERERDGEEERERGMERDGEGEKERTRVKDREGARVRESESASEQERER